MARSWERCLRDGLDPEHSVAPVDLSGSELIAHREEHPLASVMPVIRRLLVDDAAAARLPAVR